MAKNKRKRKGPLFPVIGKYIDTPTKAELEVVYFVDDIGEYRLTIGNLPPVVLKSCRFQLKSSQLKTKKAFAKKLKPLLDFSGSWKEAFQPVVQERPFIFGLLKMRRGKVRKFVWVQSADQFFKSRVINIMAVTIDNLLYLDLVGYLKEKA